MPSFAIWLAHFMAHHLLQARAILAEFETPKNPEKRGFSERGFSLTQKRLACLLYLYHDQSDQKIMRQMQPIHQAVNFLKRVIKCKRRPA